MLIHVHQFSDFLDSLISSGDTEHGMQWFDWVFLQKTFCQPEQLFSLVLDLPVLTKVAFLGDFVTSPP